MPTRIRNLQKLHANEAEQLAHHEAVIERGITTFYEVGTALLHIRDGRLYRATHDTFEAYCRERWGMSRVHAHRMIDAAQVAENLLPMGNATAEQDDVPSPPVASILPVNERQIRPLVSLSPENQRTVWIRAVEESGGQPTARKVSEVVHISILSEEQVRAMAAERERHSQVLRVIDAIKTFGRLPLTTDELTKRILRLNNGSNGDLIQQSEDGLRNYEILDRKLRNARQKKRKLLPRLTDAV